MNNIITNLKLSGITMWILLSFLSIVFLSVSKVLILEADFFADNIKFLLDDPYIYWILGWILFVISFISFSVSGINLVQGCIQYIKNKKSESVISEE